MDTVKLRELEAFALRIRIGVVEQIKARGFGHIGGSLSIADALAVLYGAVMSYDPENPKMEERDKLVSSKGHAGPAIYAALALKGFFPYSELVTLNRPGTKLPSHCDRNKTPGIDMTTGSLGQGTSLAVGMALGDMLKERKNRVFLITGDGELDEGQAWEAAMFASAKKVNNLVWLVDNNKKQLDGTVSEVLDTFSLEHKFASFGFEAHTVNGNDIEELYAALSQKASDRPIALILDTVKGFGIKDVENTEANHSMNVSDETCDKWLAALREELKALEKGGE